MHTQTTRGGQVVSPIAQPSGSTLRWSPVRVLAHAIAKSGKRQVVQPRGTDLMEIVHSDLFLDGPVSRAAGRMMANATVVVDPTTPVSATVTAKLRHGRTAKVTMGNALPIVNVTMTGGGHSNTVSQFGNIPTVNGNKIDRLSELPGGFGKHYIPAAPRKK